MWSDPTSGPRDDKAIAQDLHAALSSAGERPPFVLVGHSLAGLYSVLYTKYFGAEVAGLVLVDSAHPDQGRRIEAINHHKFTPLVPIAKLAAQLAWTGLPRLLVGSDAPKGMETSAAYAPTSLVAIVEELKTIDQTFADAAASHDFGARPLYVLTAMAPASPDALAETQMTAEQDRQFRPVWKQLHEDEATWSSNSQLLLVPDSGHRIQTDRPDIVVRAVLAVIDAVRGGHRLQP
jgi:pimeloyl-ACP methyl ester carboxylesterase